MLVRSKSWNILENLEGVLTISVQTCLWAVLTSFKIMNRWMILTSRPWRVMKKSFEICASFWLWILQIAETAATGRSKFLLKQDRIWALWNVTRFEAWIWILLETAPSYPAMPSKNIRGIRTSNQDKSNLCSRVLFFKKIFFVAG